MKVIDGYLHQDLDHLRKKDSLNRKNEAFKSFKDLNACFTEGKDFEIGWRLRPSSPLVLIAPHGGTCEPNTCKIARLIADQQFSYYTFESRLEEKPELLHITSKNFDDPVCDTILKHSQLAITVHGCGGESKSVFVGGRAKELKKSLIKLLKKEGFEAYNDLRFPGVHKKNLCNRGSLGSGIQLELTQGFRDSFAANATSEEKASASHFTRIIREYFSNLTQDKMDSNLLVGDI